MIARRDCRRLSTVLAAGLIASFCMAVPVAANPPAEIAPRSERAQQPARADADRVTWRELEFEAKKFFITAETRARFERVPSSEGEEVRIRIDTEALGKRTSDEILLAAATANTKRRQKRQYDKEPYAKIYRFGKDRIHETRCAPADEAERQKPPEEWSRRREKEYRPADSGACPYWSDPTALLYVASAREWKIGDPPVELCIFSDETFSRMTIRAVDTAMVDVEYRVGQGEHGEERRGEVETVVLEIDVAPHDADADRETTFEVLGLEDDVRFHVDRKHRLPVLITGKMDVVGRVKIKLRRAELR